MIERWKRERARSANKRFSQGDRRREMRQEPDRSSKKTAVSLAGAAVSFRAVGPVFTVASFAI
jgi:hypothetical protein